MRYLFIFSLLLAAVGCQPSLDGCYSGNVGRDTVFLSLTQQGKQVTGNLIYQYAERDRNEGSVQGEMLGDSLLMLDYNFHSEGVESRRQIAFLLQNGKLSEGTGTLVEEDEGFLIKDVSELKFGNSFVLSPDDCGPAD